MQHNQGSCWDITEGPAHKAALRAAAHAQGKPDPRPADLPHPAATPAEGGDWVFVAGMVLAFVVLGTVAGLVAGGVL